MIAITALTLPVKYTAALMGVYETKLTMPMRTWSEQVLSALWFTMLLGWGALLNISTFCWS